MLSNVINVASSTAKPLKHARLWPVSVALAMLAVFIIATTGSAASPQPQSAQPPQAPNATCPPDGQCFADVPSGNPFYTFVNRIYQQDLVSGYACGGLGEPCDAQHRPYYRPNNNVTRSQMSKFIDNARHLPQIHIEASSTDPLIYVTNSSGPGIFGMSTGTGGTGVFGSNDNGTGVFGSSSTGWAGYFNGNVYVSGHITATGGCCAAPELSTRIDDPLDPANKYLNESSVQSPDMTTVINGNAILDDKGEATVALPSWFEVANRDFRYTLTAVGSPGPNLYISQELSAVSADQFKIGGGKAGGKVSWQVTGVRQDPYANAHAVQVEQDKPANEKGKYLHPAEYGQPQSSGIDYDARQSAQHMTESKP